MAVHHCGRACIPSLPTRWNQAAAAQETPRLCSRTSLREFHPCTYSEPPSFLHTILQSPSLRLMSRVNPWKTSGSDGVPGLILKTCTDQLVEVFADVFNLLLPTSEIPTCFRKELKILVSKKNKMKCLNDYRPVVQTSLVMVGKKVLWEVVYGTC